MAALAVLIAVAAAGFLGLLFFAPGLLPDALFPEDIPTPAQREEDRQKAVRARAALDSLVQNEKRLSAAAGSIRDPAVRPQSAALVEQRTLLEFAAESIGNIHYRRGSVTAVCEAVEKYAREEQMRLETELASRLTEALDGAIQALEILARSEKKLRNSAEKLGPDGDLDLLRRIGNSDRLTDRWVKIFGNGPNFKNPAVQIDHRRLSEHRVTLDNYQSQFRTAKKDPVPIATACRNAVAWAEKEQARVDEPLVPLLVLQADAQKEKPGENSVMAVLAARRSANHGKNATTASPPIPPP